MPGVQDFHWSIKKDITSQFRFYHDLPVGFSESKVNDAQDDVMALHEATWIAC